MTDRIQTQQALTAAFAHGRLEIVDTILHNVGNAINSVSIGVGTVCEELARNEPLRVLRALAQAVEAHRGDWLTYLATDLQGRTVRPLILALATDFVSQNERLQETAARVKKRVEHIVDIIGPNGRSATAPWRARWSIWPSRSATR